jgi:hypothetical protein
MRIIALIDSIPVLFPEARSPNGEAVLRHDVQSLYKTPHTSILSSIKYAITNCSARRQVGGIAGDMIVDLDHMALRRHFAPLPSGSELTRTLKEFIGALPSFCNPTAVPTFESRTMVPSPHRCLGEHMLAAEHTFY